MCDLPLFCITGTDTDVGKSIVTSALLKAFVQKGFPARGIKAVQTGCAGTEEGYISPDAALYTHVSPESEIMALECLELSCSPHLAARQEDRILSVPSLAKRIRTITGLQSKVTLIEGAGGLFVPLNTEECIIDLFQALEAPVVLVAPNRLGTINQVLLNLNILRSRNIPVAGVVLNTTMPVEKEDALAADIAEDNVNIISRMGNVPPPLCLPYLPALREQSGFSEQSIWELLAGLFMPVVESLLSAGVLSRQRAFVD